MLQVVLLPLLPLPLLPMVLLPTLWTQLASGKLSLTEHPDTQPVPFPLVLIVPLSLLPTSRTSVL
jgi:hypothetical protein